MKNKIITTVHLDQDDFEQLKKHLTSKHKSFSGWLRDKMEMELASHESTQA